MCDFRFDGEAAIDAVLEKSEYGSASQAIASLTLFTHPVTVKQTTNRALFRIRRYRAGQIRGQIIDGERVIVCDNYSPKMAFVWANNLRNSQMKELQFNHVYSCAYDPEFYTSLANICVTPAFLGKLTDKSQKIRSLLRFRVYELYGFSIPQNPIPEEPKDYCLLRWADTLPPCDDLRARLLGQISRNEKSRIAKSIREFGWLLSQ